jgi:hypothetical protein
VINQCHFLYGFRNVEDAVLNRIRHNQHALHKTASEAPILARVLVQVEPLVLALVLAVVEEKAQSSVSFLVAMVQSSPTSAEVVAMVPEYLPPLVEVPGSEFSVAEVAVAAVAEV